MAYGSKIRKLGEMLGPDGLATDNLVDFLLKFPIRGRILQEVVETKGQQARGSFVAGNQKRNELICDVVIAQLLARGRIHAVQHGIQQILAFAGVRLAMCHDLVRRGPHGGNVLPVLFVGGAVEKVGRKRRSLVPSSGLGEEAAHGLDKGVQFLVVE